LLPAHPSWSATTPAAASFWEAGSLKPRIARTFPLAAASEALAALLSRRYAGKIVLEA
jgi:NADPH:quinone reductase-like Zn-dependent oxidoreductase